MFVSSFGLNRIQSDIMRISISEIQDNFPKRSLSVTSQYNKNLSDFLNSQIARTKLEHQVETSGDAVVFSLFYSFGVDQKYLRLTERNSRRSARFQNVISRYSQALDSSHTSLIKKPIYTSDESADNSQLYISSSSYEEQEMVFNLFTKPSI